MVLCAKPKATSQTKLFPAVCKEMFIASTLPAATCTVESRKGLSVQCVAWKLGSDQRCATKVCLDSVCWVTTTAKQKGSFHQMFYAIHRTLDKIKVKSKFLMGNVIRGVRQKGYPLHFRLEIYVKRMVSFVLGLTFYASKLCLSSVKTLHVGKFE